MSDLHFMLEWDHYCLSFDKPFTIDFSQEWQAGQPAFYQYRFTLEELADTFINLQEFGKGIVLVNGHHIGRFCIKVPSSHCIFRKGFYRKKMK